MKALVTGGTGFIGRQLVRTLVRPVVLTRSLENARRLLGEQADCRLWQPEEGPPPATAFEGVDVVFHLAGDPVVEGRWSKSKKERIRRSRVESTRNLVAGMRALGSRPKALIAASAIGFYGDRGETELDESSAAGDDFLADVCAEWEAASRTAADLGLRVVQVRTGIVLGRGGGALAKMLPPFKLGAGGPLGSGRQWMSWIHLDDIVGLYMLAAESGLSGPVAGVSPGPVTNAEFSKTLGRVLRRPAFMPAPAPLLRLALGEVAAVLLASQRVIPRAALKAGYAFRHPALEGALREILAG